MRRAYRQGLKTAVTRWRLVLFVFFVSLLGGLTFMGCAWLWLADVLDASLATRTLATSLDAEIFIDILAQHDGSLRVFVGLAGMLLVGGLLLWTWINALIVRAVTATGTSVDDTAPGASGRYRSFLFLWLLAALCNTAALAAIYGCWTVLDGWAVQGNDEIKRYWAAAVCILAGGLVLLTITAVHDHARVRCVDATGGAGRCFLWAWAYVLRERRAIPLTTSLLATSFVVWLCYHALARVIPTTATLGLTLSLAWGQMFMLTRAVLRIWSFAAAAELQQGSEDA